MIKTFKYIGLISLTTSYTLLILTLVFEFSETTYSNIFNLTWGFGVLSVITNAIYAIKINISDLALSSYGTFGIIWFVPFFIDESYGIVSLIIFLMITIYIHSKPIQNNDKTA